jgi:hypothetical protein
MGESFLMVCDGLLIGGALHIGLGVGVSVFHFGLGDSGSLGGFIRLPLGVSPRQERRSDHHQNHKGQNQS